MISKTHLTSDTPITEAFRQGTVLMDADAIRAEIHSRDSTLTAIALQAGLCESACRAALIRPSLAGEKAIALFLGVPAQFIWPDRYSADGTPIRRRAPKRPSALQDTKRTTLKSPEKLAPSPKKRR